MQAATTIRLAFLAPLAMLTGCISLGEDPPDRLLTLTAEELANAGSDKSAMRAETLKIYELEVPAAIDVTRVPVMVNSSEIAYLKDALWVEKPAKMFRRLMAETIRARTGRVVIDGDDPALSGGESLRGMLRRFGYDAGQSEAVVVYDAIREGDDGKVELRRFEAVVSGVIAEPLAVGQALNRASNDVARQVSDWIAGG